MAKLSAIDVNRAALLSLRHFVPFCYYARSPKIFASRGIAQPIVCSSFLMQAENLWCLVTAGHVLDGIDKDRKDGNELVNFRLLDGWAPESSYTDYIPFDFDSLPKYRLNVPGLDYGLIVLNTLSVDNLIANKSIPINESSYKKSDFPDEFDAYAMIGVPGKTVSLTQISAKNTVFTYSPNVMHLEKEPNPPEELIKSTSRFYGRILVPEDAPEWLAIGSDIAGMSGGPIIGIKRIESCLHYWIIGIQSGWIPSQRVIAACPFKEFACYVANAVALAKP